MFIQPVGSRYVYALHYNVISDPGCNACIIWYANYSIPGTDRHHVISQLENNRAESIKLPIDQSLKLL